MTALLQTPISIANSYKTVPSDSQQPFSTRRAYAATFAATVATRCVGMITGVLSARLLGPTGRGELAVIIFLPVLLLPIVEIELPRSIAYTISKREEPLGELVATSFWLAIVLGAVQVIVLMTTLRFFLSADKLYLLGAARWFAAYLPAANIALFLTGTDLGKGAMGRFALFQTLPGGIYLVSVLFAWWMGAISPAGFAFGVLLGMAITAAVRVILDWRAIVYSRPRWSVGWNLLKRGMTFYVPAVAGFMLIRSDTFLLVRMTTAEAIGLYAVAQAIATGQIGAVLPFVQVGFAAVAREMEHEKALQTLAHHFRLAQFAVAGIGLAAAALTPWAIPLLFGTKFSQAMTATYLLIVASIFWGLGQVLEQGLRAANHPRTGITSNLAGLAVLLALGIPACLRFGINGMAASLAIAQCVNLATLVALCVVKLKMPLRFFWAFEPRTVRELETTIRIRVDGVAS
jgi:O-antigen/teichoic acid export membrane protein